MESMMKNPYPLTFKEEVGNSISHGIMALCVVLSLPYYAVHSYLRGGMGYSFGVSVFMLGLFMMFMTSCLYHCSIYGTTQKYVFRKLDHIMILVAIASTYTPICLVYMNHVFGYILLILEWLMAFGGILLKAISKKSYPKCSMIIYMTMGWLAIFFVPQLFRNGSFFFMAWIVLGGILYSVGAIFYAQPQKRYFHFIWHLLIIGASICHMIGILYCMV